MAKKRVRFKFDYNFVRRNFKHSYRVETFFIASPDSSNNLLARGVTHHLQESVGFQFI